MKIQRAVPPSFRLIDLAKAGVAIKLINPTINPTFNPLIFFPMFSSSFVLISPFDNASAVPRVKRQHKELKCLKNY
jgi:hypothetical protein